MNHGLRATNHVFGYCDRAVGDRVFVCYAHEDAAFVVRLATKLKALGVLVWLDDWDLAPGSDWDRSIDRALAECSRLLIVLSKASVASNEVRAELRTALDLQKPVIPILREPCDVPRQLRTIQFVDATGAEMDEDVVARRAMEILKSPARGSEPEEAATAATPGVADDGIRHDLARAQHAGHLTAVEAHLERTTSDLRLQLAEAESRFDWDAVIELGERLLHVTAEHQPTAARTAAAYRWRAVNREADKRDEEALSDYTRGVELEPADADTCYRRGIVHRRLAMKFNTSAHLRAAVGDFQSASRLWRAGQSLHAKAITDIERARAEDFLETAAAAYVLPAIGAIVLSMILGPMELGFVPRLGCLAGAGITSGLVAAAADSFARSAWGLKSDKRLALVLMLVGGVVGVGTGYVFPPPADGELYPVVVDLVLALPAVTAPFVVVVAGTRKQEGLT